MACGRRSVAERLDPTRAGSEAASCAERENDMNDLKDAQREMRERQSKHEPSEAVWYSIETLAARWDCSLTHATTIVQGYAGEKGYMDQGVGESVHHKKRS